MTSSPNRPERHDRTGDAWTSDGPQHVGAVSYLGVVTAYQLLVRLGYLLRPDHWDEAQFIYDMGTEPPKCSKRGLHGGGKQGPALARWRAVSKGALGHHLPMHHAAHKEHRRELYDICVYLVAAIEQRTPRPCDADWFPNGWRDAMALVKGERRKQGHGEMSEDERRQLLQRQVEQMRRRAG